MKTEHLVILKGNEKLEFKTGIVEPHKHYRCISITDNGITQYLVYGFVFTKEDFDCLFELSHIRIIRDFKALGLITPNGKPLSKAAFIKMANIHKYGTFKYAKQIWVFRNSRDLIYGFYPSEGTKVETGKECYRWFLEVIQGNMSSIDNGNIVFGNSGIPLIYSKLRVS